ncbi:MAG: hypothetical protein K6U04_15630 [Armatimonadetes bacterium]|nr:hypothetical protein [Armatimonadota bacterium]
MFKGFGKSTLPAVFYGIKEIQKTAEFKEKPDEQTARTYIEKGYLWNSGMFMFPSGVFAEEAARCCPEVYRAFTAEDINAAYRSTPAISITGLWCGGRRR